MILYPLSTHLCHVSSPFYLRILKFDVLSVIKFVSGLLPFLMRAQISGNEIEKPIKPTNDDLIKALEDVRLGYILSRFGSLDSTCEWSSVLSLGEQQRLAFARLLLSKPKLVLLDESTSALDEANEVSWIFNLLFYNASFIFRLRNAPHCFILPIWELKDVFV